MKSNNKIFWIYIFIIFIMLTLYLKSGDGVRFYTPFYDGSNGTTYCYWLDPNTDNTCEFQDRLNYNLYSGGIFNSSSTEETGELFKVGVSLIVNCMTYDNDYIYIGTQSGVYKKLKNTDPQTNCTWVQMGTNMNSPVFAMVFYSSELYIGGSFAGIYKWNGTNNFTRVGNFDKTVNCLRTNSSILLAGASDGVYKINSNKDDFVELEDGSKYINEAIYSVDISHSNNDFIFCGGATKIWRTSNGGDDWDYESTYSNVKAILIYFHSGTYNQNKILASYGDNGNIVKSIDGGENWTSANYTLANPNIVTMEYCGSTLYIGSNGSGIFYAVIQSGEIIGWSATSFSNDGDDNNCNFLCSRDHNSETYACCDFGELYPGAELYKYRNLFEDETNEIDEENTPKYGCHGYAWHISEAGLDGVFVAPGTEQVNFYTGEGSYEVVDPDDITYWSKLLYGNVHSAIAAASDDNNPTDFGDRWVISKWNTTGPLMKHKIENCPFIPFTGSYTYYSSRKEFKGSGDLSGTIQIGKHLFIEGTYTCSTNVNLHIAPMLNSYIDIKSYFHAISGSSLHAYIQGSAPPYGGSVWCSIPKQTAYDDEISVKDIIKENFNGFNFNNNNYNIILNVYPSPANDYFNVLVECNECYSGLLNLELYNLTGDLIFQKIINNTNELNEIPLTNISSGMYFIKINGDIKINKDTQNIDLVKIIQILK